MGKLPWYVKQVGKLKCGKDKNLVMRIKITKLGKIYLLLKVLLSTKFWNYSFE